MREHDPSDGPPERPKWWLHALLFVAALGSMCAAGMQFTGEPLWALASWKDASALGQALAYAACLMAILFTHEMGHYVHCKREGVVASPPFFLPGLPIPGLGVIPLFGTFGAFIKMHVRPMSAPGLLRIGAWGPLAGFVVTIPVLIVGFMLSDVRPVPDVNEGLQLGDSLLLVAMQKLFYPDMPSGHDVFLHPVAMAGWTGAFFTGFNLIPIGQLDGGHICYTVFGERFNRVAWGLWGALGIAGALWFPGWLLLCAFLFFTKPTHPRMLQGPLVGKQPAMGLAVASAVVFALTFTPRPFKGLGLWSWLAELF